MPVLNEDSTTEESTRFMRHYIRIQNLPWTACSSDIKKFFRGLPIKQGGVLVRNFEAFVAFETLTDVRLALHRRNILLHGCKLELSIVNEVELRKILFRIARRKLDFDNMDKRGVAKLYFEDPPRKKIRPTPVVKESKHRSVSCSAFLPTEIEPSSCSSNESSSSDCSSTGIISYKRSVVGMRRLHPTSVTSTLNMDNLAVFHPEESCQEKEMRVDE